MKIVLCGFMGCGKSSIGRRLAGLLNWEFIDMDAFIEHAKSRLWEREPKVRDLA